MQQKKSWLSQQISRLSLSLSLGIFSVILGTIPGFAAERIAFVYPPFGEFYIYIEDLEIFAEEGRITNKFAFYAERATPEQLTVLRELLNENFEVNPITAYRFTHSPTGETILKRLGNVIKADFNQNGFYALRSALGQAAAQPEGLTIINVLRYFPLETIRLDLELVSQLIDELSRLFREGDLIINTIQQRAKAEAGNEQQVDFSALPDLRRSGDKRWRKETFTFTNPKRQAPVPVDLYLPLGVRESLPVIIISHGLASDRNTFAYLAQHFASYGLAVAVLEHPGSSAAKINRVFAGFDAPPDPTILLNRPLDVTYLLNELSIKSQSEPQRFGNLNLEEVGVIGQSLGGYTVLALGGAQLNLKNLQQECQQAEANQLSLNVSLLLQCRATELPLQTYDLRDERVKAVIAVNPVSSAIFGKEGLSQIQVPVMLITGSEDLFAPAVPEQIYPFTSLTIAEKYLVVMENGTHFSFLGGKGQGVLPVPPELIGPDPTLAYPYLRALGLAFFKTYILNQAESRSYLSESYLQTIREEPFNPSVVESLTEAQIEEAINSSPVND